MKKKKLNNKEFKELHGVKLMKPEKEIILGVYRDKNGEIIRRKIDEDGNYTETKDEYLLLDFLGGKGLGGTVPIMENFYLRMLEMITVTIGLNLNWENIGPHLMFYITHMTHWKDIVQKIGA